MESAGLHSDRITPEHHTALFHLDVVFNVTLSEMGIEGHCRVERRGERESGRERGKEGTAVAHSWLYYIALWSWKMVEIDRKTERERTCG